MPKTGQIIPPIIDAHIHIVRDRRVMLDSDLAALYDVETKALNRAVRRNCLRFPADFMFQLTREEVMNLKRQIGTSSSQSIRNEHLEKMPEIARSTLDAGGRRYQPYVFTQEGVAMLSGVLRSPRAVAVNIEIMRAFLRLRRLALSVKELAAKVEALEQKYDSRFGLIFEAIKELMTQAEPPPEDEGTIGFLGRPKKGGAT